MEDKERREREIRERSGKGRFQTTELFDRQVTDKTDKTDLTVDVVRNK